MKVWLIRLVLLFFFSGQTELHEFCKLPFLFEHFAEHQKENANMSFSDFLHEHYSHAEGSNSAPADHRLPFKDHCGASIIAAVQHVTFVERSMLVIYQSSDLLSSYETPGYSPGHVDDIFQPPRLS